jgi:ABC-type lipoprotein release transport system permease subunit
MSIRFSGPAMYKLFVAFRYLRRNWLNLVGTLAVALAVMAPICVLSVMKGFDQEFRSRIRATLSDLIVERRTDDPFGGYEGMMARIAKIPHVVACAPQYDGLGLLKLRRQSRYVEFHGVNLAGENQATDFAEFWRMWRGRQARLELAELAAQGSGLGGEPKQKVAGLLSSMRHEDFSLLDSADRDAAKSWAAYNQVDLEAALRAGDTAVPEWGPAGDPKYSPAFPGEELVVLGKYPDGREASLDTGDEVTLIAASDVFERTFRRCRIVGKFRSGMSEYDLRNIYLPLADVQEFMQQPDKVTSISIRLDSFDHAPEVRSALLGILTPEEMAEGLDLVRPLLRKQNPVALNALDAQFRQLRLDLPKWFADRNPQAVESSQDMGEELERVIADVLHSSGGSVPKAALERMVDFQKKVIARANDALGMDFRVSTWEDKRLTFLRAVALERQVMAFILFFVGLIAGFLILSLLHTTVISKTRDIGTLKSIGGSVHGIMSIFLLNGLLMGLIGSAIGTAGGFLITRNINAIEGFLERIVGFSLFPSDIYYLDRIPVDQHPWPGILTICVLAVAVSLAASVLPAWKAARMDAVEALRYE